MEITLESRLKIAVKEHYSTLGWFMDRYVDEGGSYEDYDKFVNDGLLTTNFLNFICKTLYNVNIEWIISGEGEKESYRKQYNEVVKRCFDAMYKNKELQDELENFRAETKTVKMDLLKIISNN